MIPSESQILSRYHATIGHPSKNWPSLILLNFTNCLWSTYIKRVFRTYTFDNIVLILFLWFFSVNLCPQLKFIELKLNLQRCIFPVALSRYYEVCQMTEVSCFCEVSVKVAGGSAGRCGNDSETLVTKLPLNWITCLWL